MAQVYRRIFITPVGSEVFSWWNKSLFNYLINKYDFFFLETLLIKFLVMKTQVNV